MIRVLHVLGALNMGGAETMVMNLYRNIDKEKIQFDFLLHGNDNGKYEKEILKLGGKIYRIPKYRLLNHCVYVKALNSFFSSHPEYSICHCHIRSTANIILKNAKKYNLKTISHSHSISNGKNLKSIIKKIYQRKIPIYSDYMFACSVEAAEWLFGRKYAKKDNCIIINNAIDTERFKFNDEYRKEIRNKYNIKEEEMLIGHVGRFTKVKNHEFIISIAEKICKENKNIIFMLCGDGELKEEIINKVNNLNLNDNIIFVESNNEIYKYYSAFDKFILPSLYEGLGMVLIEAQFSGLECFVSNKIPNEAKISNYYRVIDFKIDEWCKNLMKKNMINRNNLDLYDSSINYDINKLSSFVMKLYLDLLNK